MINSALFSSLLKVTRSSAIACFDYIGRGDSIEADRSAVSAMRRAFQQTPIKGEVVIGEGERDRAPMLYIGEKVGSKGEGETYDIAVDPLEGTNFCAKGQEGAISVLALAEKGGLLRAPDIYMEKLACGPKAQACISLTNSPAENIQAVAQGLNKSRDEIKVAILNRPRHKALIQAVYDTGACVLLIEDGDLSASILTTHLEGGVDLMMGTGGAPEGVLSACALKCLGGGFQGRLVFQEEEQKNRARKMGIDNLDKIYDRDEIAKASVFFCATGVTNGPLLKGVQKTELSTLPQAGESAKAGSAIQYKTNSLYMRSADKEIHKVYTTQYLQG